MTHIDKSQFLAAANLPSKTATKTQWNASYTGAPECNQIPGSHTNKCFPWIKSRLVEYKTPRLKAGGWDFDKIRPILVSRDRQRVVEIFVRGTPLVNDTILATSTEYSVRITRTGTTVYSYSVVCSLHMTIVFHTVRLTYRKTRYLNNFQTICSHSSKRLSVLISSACFSFCNRISSIAWLPRDCCCSCLFSSSEASIAFASWVLQQEQELLLGVYIFGTWMCFHCQVIG